MSRVYVTSRHFEPHSHTLTGLTLHVQFEGGTADVSMLDMSGLPEPDRWNSVLRLGEAIVQGGEPSAASTIEPNGA
jgi:hypothetical protein